MGDMVKITDLRCPGCGSTLKMPAGNAKTVQCEYCGNEYVIDTGSDPSRGATSGFPGNPGIPGNPSIPGNPGNPGTHPTPQWQATSPVNSLPEPKRMNPVLRWIMIMVCFVGLVAIRVYRKMPDRDAQQQRTQREVMESISASVSAYNPAVATDEEEGLSGLLEQVVAAAFGKDAGSVTQEELNQIQWIADKSDFESISIGYSFENPLENPDAELEWLTFPTEIGSRSDRGYSSLYMLGGLKKLETKQSIALCDLRGLSLESLGASFGTPEEAAAALDDPSTIRQLTVSSSIKSMDGLDLFPNLENLTIDASNLSDVNAVVALGQLKSLTLEDADSISDFGVFASMENLEELNIESENLKALDFLSRMPQLKSLGLADGQLLSLDGVEVLESLERLSVTDCSDLKNMDAVASLTGLTELSLERPYDCGEPSLAGLNNLRSLTLDNFDSCAFLPGMTNLEELTLRGCDMPSNLDLSGLTKLKRLTCVTFYRDRSLAFVEKIPSLEYVNLTGMVTYEDISGLFALPNVKELKLSGIECEIDFDKVSDNSSLESLEMAGVRLYENVKVHSSGGITNVYYDDVFLVDHLDFFGHFPSLKKLDVAENKISDLEFAAGLVNLEEIDFSDNYVTDMHVLASIPALRLVNCAGNPISNMRVLDETHVHIISE